MKNKNHMQNAIRQNNTFESVQRQNVRLHYSNLCSEWRASEHIPCAIPIYVTNDLDCQFNMQIMFTVCILPLSNGPSQIHWHNLQPHTIRIEATCTCTLRAWCTTRLTRTLYFGNIFSIFLMEPGFMAGKRVLVLHQVDSLYCDCDSPNVHTYTRIQWMKVLVRCYEYGHRCSCINSIE